jgi:hypothetical protein
MKKCPFMLLGSAPKSDLAGSKEMVIVMGNCMENECALWGELIVGEKIIEAGCSIAHIARGIYEKL